MSARRPLVIAGVCLIGLFFIGLPWAIADGLRAYVGSGETPDGTLDWIWTGSNLTAPLIPFLAFALGVFLATRSGRAALAGEILMLALSLLFFVASLGEPWLPAEADSPSFLLVLYHVALFALVVSVAALAARALLARRGGQGVPA